MWQNPTNLANYTPSRNNLAVARSLLQIDGNYRLNENNTFFTRGWFVYEPPYSFNSANNPNYHVPNHASFGHMMNGYYNTYELRDAWWENKTGPLTTFIGNQKSCGDSRWRSASATWSIPPIPAGLSGSPTLSNRGCRSGWSIRF
jgi:hypothetical protein